jgi:hypothetical protein
VQARLGPRVAPALGGLDLAPLGRGVDLFEHRHVVVALAPLEVLGGFAGRGVGVEEGEALDSELVEGGLRHGGPPDRT